MLLQRSNMLLQRSNFIAKLGVGFLGLEVEQ
jgi:hypothetical protein